MQQQLIQRILLKGLTDLANLESDVDKLDIDKLKNVPNTLKVKQINQILENQKPLQLI